MISTNLSSLARPALGLALALGVAAGSLGFAGPALAAKEK